MKLHLALAAATCLALPLAAKAQPVTGPYVSLGAGTTIATPFNYQYEGGGNFPYFHYSGKFLTRPDYSGVVGAGYGFGNGFRVELGGNFYRNTMHADDNEDGGHYPVGGGQNTYGPMVSALYDFDVGLPIFPYIGAGVGYQWIKLAPRINDVPSVSDTVEGTQGSFAYQVIAGLSYPLPMLPGLSLTAEYRFMQVTESRKYASSYYERFNQYEGPVKLGQESFHTFTLGLRYQLFAPPMMATPMAAPVAAPAPAAAKTYLVFFDWDKYALTPRATQIIAEAASDSKTNNVTTLNVSGYTDTSGTPTYNQGLSLRRAKAVEAKLVMDGVPASEISIHAFGETHLLVPTGPGVREPQNRRVEIVLQ